MHWVPLKWLEMDCRISTDSPSARAQNGDAAFGYQRTITELRAAVEDRSREADKAAARIKALEQEKAKAERWACLPEIWMCAGVQHM